MRIGQKGVVSITDPTKTAETVRAFLSQTISEVLRIFPWSASIKRVVLATVATPNNTTFAHGYVLPVDCIRVFDLNGDKMFAYRIEGKKLFTNEEAPKLRYCSLITAPDFDSLLAETIIARLASKMCFHITGDVTLATQLYQEYVMDLSVAAKTAAGETQDDLVDLLQMYTTLQVAQRRNPTEG